MSSGYAEEKKRSDAAPATSASTIPRQVAAPVRDDLEAANLRSRQQRQYGVARRELELEEAKRAPALAPDEAKQPTVAPALDEVKQPTVAPALDEKKQATPAPAEPPRVLGILDLKVPADVDRLREDEVPKAEDRNAAYRLLHDVFGQSWHTVKHELAEPATSNPRQRKVRQELAAQLIDYRNWSYELTLTAAGRALNDELKSSTAYTGIKNKGSTALTSDVDLMLQGDATELMVPRFNAFFKEGKGTGHRFDYEPGIVYDVNAYEMGYVTDPDRGVEKKDAGVKVPLKQGARKARPEGGVGPAGLGEPDFQAEDRQNQSAAALLKLRLHMTGREWGEHRRGVQANVPATAAAFDQAETMFADYYVRIARGLLGPDAMPLDPRSDDAMAKAGTKLLEGLARRKVHGAEAKESEAHDPAVMNALMSVSNREVERLLTEQVYKLRREVEGLIKQQDRLSPSRQAEKLALESDINARLVELRLVGAKVQSFANEAYFTDAGLQHAVVGMQAEQGIQLTKADGMNVVIENMGDALKELGHYEDANEALYKAAKYMLRLADAAMNMGYGYIGAVRRLYDVGRSAAVDIKNRKPAEEAGESKAAQTATEAAPLFGGHWPVPRATPDVQLSRAELRAAVIEAGTLVEKEYHLELRARLPEEKEREVAARGAATAETPGRPTLKKADYASASAAAGHPRLEPLDPTHPRDAPEAKAGEAKRTQEAVKALGELESLPS